MIGKTVLQYQLLEKLGSGGMGEVYKAQDTRLNRFVAIKVLPAKMSADPERRRRFIQEAQAASALNHPSIITIYDIVNEGDAQYMVMEFVSGHTLHDLLAAGGLPVPQVLQYGAQIADALSTAHAAGIIHRDLKPSNIMITQSGLVKILDFGLAKLTDLSAGSGDNQATAMGPLTQEGAILGTVSYMSPEQAEGKPVDARSDIFSFGSVLYEMITGRRAFDAGSSISTLSSVLRDDVRPIGDVAPNTPPLLEAILSRCLAKDPGARWQSMREVEKALSSLRRQLDAVFYIPTQPIVAATAPPPAPPSETATVTVRSPAPPPASPPMPAAPLVAAPPAPAAPTQPAGAAAQPQGAPQAAARPRSFSGLMVGFVVLLIAAAAAGGVWRWWNSRQQPAPQQTAQVPAPQTASPAPAPVAENPPPAPAEPAAPAETVLNNAGILDMVQAKTPAADIVQKIRTSKTNFNVSREELNRLKQAGVPADVIQAMRNAAKPPAAPAGTTQVAAIPIPPPPKPGAQPAAIPQAAPPRRPAVATVPVAVSDALPFRILLAADVPADAAEGQALRFTAIDGLSVDNNIVIAKGATVTGTIAGETHGKKILGIGGGNKLTFRLIDAGAVDGKKLNVRCMSGRRADGPTIRTFETVKSAKVKGLAAAQGTEYIAYIDGDQTVSVRKP